MKEKRSKIFTFIEILLVVAIIALIMCLLLPSLNQAREIGYRIRCAGNIKQVQMAALAYADTWNGYLIVAGWPGNSEFYSLLGVKSAHWKAGLYCPNATYAISTSNPCYSYGQSYEELNSNWASLSFKGYFLPKICNPSKKIDFGDCLSSFMAYSGSKPQNYWTWLESSDGNVVATAYRHSRMQSANISFFDGHVENRFWQTLYDGSYSSAIYNQWMAYHSD